MITLTPTWFWIVVALVLILGTYTVMWFATDGAKRLHNEWVEQESYDRRAEAMEHHPAGKGRREPEPLKSLDQHDAYSYILDADDREYRELRNILRVHGSGAMYRVIKGRIDAKKKSRGSLDVSFAAETAAFEQDIKRFENMQPVNTRIPRPRS